MDDRGSYKKRFLPDPSNHEGFICFECNAEIQDTLYEFSIDIEAPENQPGGLKEFVENEDIPE